MPFFAGGSARFKTTGPAPTIGSTQVRNDPFLSAGFPYVCPEPVLVKRCVFISQWLKTKETVFGTRFPYAEKMSFAQTGSGRT